jgi:alkylation response protein AidB-like acyl-CoA dehydrogenase
MEQEQSRVMPSVAAASSQSANGPVERIGRISDVIARSGAANEELGRLTPEVVDKLHEQRLFRMLLPRAYGGEEVGLVTWFRAMEALAKLDGSTAWCVGQINGCAASSSALEPAVARKIWSEPHSALSWGPPNKSRADEVDGGHRLNGEWGFSSGSRHATWIGLMAPVFDKKGAPVPVPGGTAFRIFLVPATAVEWVDNWGVVGLNATNSGGFKVSNLLVPQGYSINRDHLREVQVASPLYKFPLNGFFSVGFSAVALGIARAMLDAVIALAQEKTPRLAKTSLLQNHHVQFQIGEAEACLRSARNYVEATAGEVHEAVVASGKLTIAQRMDMRMAATFAIHEAKLVADTAWEVAGANAIFASGPFERRMRDLRTLLQQAQGRKAHLQDAGAFILGLEANLAFA